jgi:hypothetical protein
MEQAKKHSLLKKATLCPEINKYSLKQLREAPHAIETDEKKKNAAPKLESKKRPKTRHYGGT